ncbi:MAG: MmcQ/YjbR family DNA-binding protein, partial [Gammaproteobacteria bacterium]
MSELTPAADSPLAQLRAQVLAKPGAIEEQPFGPSALVYKVAGKMFALIAWQAEPLRISLKCEPFEAEALRDEFDAIQPGYHLNKRHWNTVTLDGAVPQFLIDGLLEDDPENEGLLRAAATLNGSYAGV